MFLLSEKLKLNACGRHMSNDTFEDLLQQLVGAK